MKIRNIDEIPERATIRNEFTRCSNPKCAKKHGPYMYAYWKENGRLRKVYIGKSIEELRFRLICEGIHSDNGHSAANVKKRLIVSNYTRAGNNIAGNYLDKIDRKDPRPKLVA